MTPAGCDWLLTLANYYFFIQEGGRGKEEMKLALIQNQGTDSEDA